MKNSKKVNIDLATDEEIKKSIADHIKAIRKSGLTLTADMVAEQLHLSRASFTQIENGKTNITAVTLWKLACLFEVPIERLFPTAPKGYALSRTDFQVIEKEDERAVGWAEKLFGGKNKK